MKKWILILALVSMSIITFSGCNTIRGMGRDVEAAGEGVQDATN